MKTNRQLTVEKLVMDSYDDIVCMLLKVDNIGEDQEVDVSDAEIPVIVYGYEDMGAPYDMFINSVAVIGKNEPRLVFWAEDGYGDIEDKWRELTPTLLHAEAILQLEEYLREN